MRHQFLFPVAAAVLLAACGNDDSSNGAPGPAASAIPAWAHVSKEQVAEAEKLNVPVAFENSIGMRFVLVPAGTFLMGSPAGEEHRSRHETQHRVTISKAYYMSIWETTNAQYRKSKPDHKSGDTFAGGDQPVVEVSHYDAARFVGWLCDQDRSHSYRLPTEAEWEYACRAGTTTPFSFGETISTDQANYDGNSRFGIGAKGVFRQKTTPVGSFPANAWGLHDMHGNAAEWCADWYSEYPSGTATDPIGPATGSARVLRGGSWDRDPWFARAAFRDWVSPVVHPDIFGFRVVASLTRAASPPGPPPPPAWAKVAPEQVAAAKALDMPVAFENSIGMRFVLIPAGKFVMGSPPEEESRDETETAHEVTLTKAYYLQTTEVTNGQYRRFKPGHKSWEQEAGHSLNGDEQPANEVSWDDAMAFIGWLNGQNPGKAYRLPTEAEWERACRAGTSTPFWWGASITTDQANYDGSYVYGGGTKGKIRRETVPVGTLPVSPWGLYEVHGNVREWCSDWYDDLDYPPGSATDPRGPPTGDSHTVRGGAYSDGVYLLRAAFRVGLQGGGETRSYVGFRVAASLPAK